MAKRDKKHPHCKMFSIKPVFKGIMNGAFLDQFLMGRHGKRFERKIHSEGDRMSLLRIDAFIKFENQILLKHKRRSTKSLKEIVDANVGHPSI